MSQFTTPAQLEMLDDFKWKLLTSFEYHVGTSYSWDVIKVPAGFVTDLTSIPRFFWTILPPHGQYAKAAIIHDYLYTNAIGSKKYADDVFFEAMTILGVARWRKHVIYYAVKIFGKGNYK